MSDLAASGSSLLQKYIEAWHRGNNVVPDDGEIEYLKTQVLNFELEEALVGLVIRGMVDVVGIGDEGELMYLINDRGTKYLKERMFKSTPWTPNSDEFAP